VDAGGEFEFATEAEGGDIDAASVGRAREADADKTEPGAEAKREGNAWDGSAIGRTHAGSDLEEEGRTAGDGGRERGMCRSARHG